MQIFSSLADPVLVSRLRAGAIGVLPTDTVYGLVCSVSHPEAVARLYTLKAREKKPGTIVAGTLQQLIDLGLRVRYLKAVEAYWPNPLSVVIPCDDTLTYLHQGQFSLAVRLPADPAFRAFLSQTGPLMTSSANLPGQPPATTRAEAQTYFGDKVDFYVEGGTITDHVPSTVIRVVDDAIEVLRPGAIHINENGRLT